MAVVAGGMFLVYAWTLAFAVLERERARGAIDRATRLAEQALSDLRAIEIR